MDDTGIAWLGEMSSRSCGSKEHGGTQQRPSSVVDVVDDQMSLPIVRALGWNELEKDIPEKKARDAAEQPPKKTKRSRYVALLT